MSIQFRRGTSTARNSSAEVLKIGQPFYEKDTKRLYIGDGSTTLNALKSAVIDEITPLFTITLSGSTFPQNGTLSDDDAAILKTSNIFLGNNLTRSNVIRVVSTADTESAEYQEVYICHSCYQGIHHGTELDYWAQIDGEYSLRVNFNLYANPVTYSISKVVATTANKLSQTLMTKYKCKLEPEATAFIYSSTIGSYGCPGYLFAGYGEGSTMSSDSVAIGPSGIYGYTSSFAKYKVTMPGKEGTMALLSDISELANVPTFEYSSTNKTLTITNVSVS